MKVLFVTSEASPYSSSGGLGDVSGSLPRALSKEGIECEVILPLYSTMKREYRQSLDFVRNVTFKLSWRDTGAAIYAHDYGGVRYYFIENHYYFDREGLYGEYDDGERFAFFCRAVVEFILQTGNIPHVLHANDWQSALSIIYLKTEYSGVTSLTDIRTLYTIHNIEYQGKYDPYILGDVFGISEKYKRILEYNGCLNLMKGGIATADFVNTVSPNYAKEIEYDYFAFGLADIIKAEKNKICGVINGIDYDIFSPENDLDIFVKFNSHNLLEGKKQNKLFLQKELGIKEDVTIPMIAMVTRLTKTKGLDLVLHIIEELLAQNIQFVILGTGEEQYESAFNALEKKWDNLVSLIKFDRVTAKKIYAAADILLMPSKSEPCGLTQMIACSYGTIPLVRSVGGLYDSIKPYGKEGGNGFRFDNYNAHELLYTINDALKLYCDFDKWSPLVASAKASKFTWKNSALKYIEIYDKIISSRKI